MRNLTLLLISVVCFACSSPPTVESPVLEELDIQLESREKIATETFQAHLLQALERYFASPINQKRENVLDVFGAETDPIVNIGDDGVERFFFTFATMVKEAEAISSGRENTEYIMGITVGYKEDRFIYWSPNYAIIY